MYQARTSLKAQATYSWTWNLVPALTVAAVLSALFLPLGNATTDTAAEPAGIEAPSLAELLVPSPQPGEGEPALVAADLPQSY